MANPNFLFTDPVVAQQAVQLFQLEQAGRDALRKNATDNIRTFAQTNTARENTASNRAITEGQLAQRDRELAQNQRQFDEGQKYREKALDVNRQLTQADIDGRREDYNRRLEDQNQVELFNALQNEVQGQDPPTDLEFEARAGALSPQRKDILNRLRVSTIRLLNDQADRAESVAAQWNAKLQALKPDDTIKREKVLGDFEKSKDRNFLDLDTVTGTFRSLVRRPRADAAPMAGGRTGGLTPIEEVRNRVRGLVGVGPVVTPVQSPGFSPNPAGFDVPVQYPGGPLVTPQQRQIGSGVAVPQSPVVMESDLGPLPPPGQVFSMDDILANQPNGQVFSVGDILEASRQPSFIPTDVGPMTRQSAPAGEVVRMADILAATPMQPSVTTLPPSNIATDPSASFTVIPGRVQSVLDMLDGSPYFDIPGSAYYLTPAQKSELTRWIAANPSAPLERVSQVLGFIRRNRQ